MSKGANQYQKLVGQNGEGKQISGLFLPWTEAFCFEISGRAEKVVVHMHCWPGKFGALVYYYLLPQKRTDQIRTLTKEIFKTARQTQQMPI